VKTANIQRDIFKQFYSGGLILPAKHFASINHITALRILNVIPRARETFTNRYTLFPLQ